MRFGLVAAFCALAASAAAQPLQLHGFLTAREIYVKAQPSWTQGAFGRFDVGAQTPDDHRKVNVETAQLGIDWTPTTWMLIHADGIARREPSGTIGKRAGLLQGFVDLHSERWRLRAGAFWLPTSRENIDPLWTSPYTVTYSALNSWIGQEFRPLGADLQFSPNFYITLGATAFRGNDTLGTELSDRGWTFGNRLTVYNEGLPEPGEQHRTKPIAHDLDGKNGYSGRIRLQLPERAMIQFIRIDNRATLIPEVHGQTPWLTKFNVIGATLGTTGPTTLAAEWSHGWTELAFPGGRFKMDFDTAYVLLSQKRGADRWTARVDRFSTRNHAKSDPDFSREQGHAVTIAWLRDMREHVRAGLEYARVKGDRPGAPDPRTGGSTITAELRYGF